MPRNVVRPLNRLCASVQRRYTPTASRAYTSDDAPPNISHQDTVQILRIADQQSLRKSKIHIDALLSHITQLRTAISALPTTIQHLPSEIPPYTLGYLRIKTDHDFPLAAEKVVSSAKNLRSHLIDLQFEAYVDRKDSAMVEFEEEIQGWTKEEKEDTLGNWLYEEEARLGRLNQSARKLNDFVNEIETMSAKVEPAAAPQIQAQVPVQVQVESSGKGVGGEVEKASNEAPGPAEKEKPVEAQSMGLGDLHKKLQAKIAEARGKP